MSILGDTLMSALSRLQEKCAIPAYAGPVNNLSTMDMLGCRSSCSGDCDDSCAGGCYGSCAGSCEYSCAGFCDNSCVGDCDNTGSF